MKHLIPTLLLLSCSNPSPEQPDEYMVLPCPPDDGPCKILSWSGDGVGAIVLKYCSVKCHGSGQVPPNLSNDFARMNADDTLYHAFGVGKPEPGQEPPHCDMPPQGSPLPSLTERKRMQWWLQCGIQ